VRPRLLLATLRAESRGARGRLVFVGACLCAGVAAVTAVAALGGAIQGGIRARSRSLLGADLSIEARRPLPETLGQALERSWEQVSPRSAPVERVDVLELATLAGAVPRSDGGAAPSRLVELKVVGPTWPLYGAVALDPPLAVASLGAERCAVAPELLLGLGLSLGDQLLLGGARFEIATTVLEEPDELAFRFTPGPRVLILDAGLARTELTGMGSRVQHKALVRLPGEVGGRTLRALVDSVRENEPEASWLRFQTHDRAQPALRRGLDRVERYLGLVALLSLLLGATGVAQVVRSWLAQCAPTIAVLRALGWRPREVLYLYLAHVAIVALVASALGAGLGALAPLALGAVGTELLPDGLLLAWQPAAIGRGLALGTSVPLFFALLPLLGVWRVAPSRVLRSEAEPLALPRGLALGAVVLAVVAVFGGALWQSESLRDAAWFSGGLALLAGLLLVASRGLARLARALPRQHLPPALAHGVAALGRPSASTIAAIVALGLGALVVVSMQLVQSRLERELANAVPQDAPTVFLIDVQPDQAEGIRKLLAEGGAERLQEVPVVTTRLSAIDGVGVLELPGRPGGPSRWALTREQRLTWLDVLPESNTLVAGSLWSDPALDEVSVEEDFARDLGAEVGTRLTFDVQGVPIELTVTSLRRVEWRSFAINFFLVAEPGPLDEAPHMRLMAARLAPGAEESVQSAILQQFPNVTLVRVRAILERVRDVFERLAFAVRALGYMTVIAGLAILAGVAASTAAQRGREVALYKTLGITRRQVALLYATEYALCGLVAGAIGSVFALVLAGAFLEGVLELPRELPLLALPVAAVAMAVLSAFAGLAASLHALAVPPLASLRG
jgi:putative ABC transport system permease protein